MNKLTKFNEILFPIMAAYICVDLYVWYMYIYQLYGYKIFIRSANCPDLLSLPLFIISTFV